MKRLTALIVVLAILIPVMVQAQVISTVERQYKWYAEEKITVSNTVKQLTSAEYSYIYVPSRINVSDPNGETWVIDEVVTEATTGAMGILKGYDSATAPTYLDLDVKYTGLDALQFDANNTITGAGGGSATIASTYTFSRGNAEGYGSNMGIDPQIAEIHVLDNSIIWTRNSSTPVYNATDASAYGRKSFEGDTIYLFGSEQIVNFKAIRNTTSDAILVIRYGY